MIWRIRTRTTFRRLAAEGRRVRAGALWCTALVDPPGTATPPRVAFAIGRPVGPAVVRARLRRRLRAIATTAAAEGRMVSGDYLIGVSPEAADSSSAELRPMFDQMLAKLR
ncbi:MAG: ribonuclease P protein component [Ilumatobacteraceae bacterium]